MTQAFATYTTQRATSNNRACLQGIVEVEARDGGWFIFSVFGFTPDQIQNAAYMEADLRATGHGWDLQALRAA